MTIQTAIAGKFRFAVYSLTGAAYILINYFTPRNHFIQLNALYLFLFISYLLIFKFWNSNTLIREAIAVSILFRVLLLFSIPNLSNDFYRFIWDGNLFSHGINPYLYSPNELYNAASWHQAAAELNKLNLLANMNSANYYSVYPPLSQFIFFITSTLGYSHGLLFNTFLLKLFMLFFETATIYLLIKISELQNINKKNVLLYASCPLIIIELTGNIHLEAGMLFFIALAIYLLVKNRILFSAIAFSFAVCIKLWPLVFLPFLFRYLGFKKTIQYIIIVALSCIILFAPFLDPSLISNYFDSLKLYVSKFEYNASIYYVLKYAAGWDSYTSKVFIQKILPVLTFSVIILFSIFYKKEYFIKALLLALTIYFLLATTVHPWYIAPLVFLCTLTNLRYPVIWSLLIYLSYAAYSNIPFRENFIFVLIEYILIYTMILFEYKKDYFLLSSKKI